MSVSNAERLVLARAARVAGVRARESQRVEDSRFLAGAGISAGDTAARAGFPTLAAAARYMYRHGQPDLANWFEAGRRKEG